MIKRPSEIELEPVAGKVLSSVIDEFQAVAARREKLKNAYMNKRAILSRARIEGQPNNRIPHGYARYIVTMASGYLLGKPVSYQADKGQENALEGVKSAYESADVQSVDAELAKNASVYGVAVELDYADGSARPRSAALDPQTAFVVYDDTVASNPLFGVHIVSKCAEDGKDDGFSVSVYTAQSVYAYRVKTLSEMLTAAPVGAQRHYFGRVPMVEYWNSDDEQGDFEQVEALIDAYDALESDRVNDKQQFVDALLLLWGARMENDEHGRTPGRQLREDKILILPDKECGAEYLGKTLTESDVEVLRDAIKSDIHKFSLVPDLTDEQFAGNSSGVAMKYKLLGLEQLMRIKERWFREALRERLRLYGAFLAVKGAPALDADAVKMVFSRALPVNELETAQTVQTYSGIVPDEMLLSQVPFVEDAAEAYKKMNAQRDEAVNRQQKQFAMSSDMDGDEER